MNDRDLEAPWAGESYDRYYGFPEKQQDDDYFITVHDEKEEHTQVDEKLDRILELCCDRICKWPSEYKDPDDLWDARCDSCSVADALDKLREDLHV